MNRRVFLRAVAATPVLGALMPANVRASVMDLRTEIESFFAWTHPVCGNWMRCATGEPYEVIAIAASTPEAAARMLVSAFRVLAQHTAQYKPQGAPIAIADERPRFLYWRRYPEVSEYELYPDSGSESSEAFAARCRRTPKRYQATARAVVSLQRSAASQLVSRT